MMPSTTRWRPLTLADFEWVRISVQTALDEWKQEWFASCGIDVTDVKSVKAALADEAGTDMRIWRADRGLVVHGNSRIWGNCVLATEGKVQTHPSDLPSALRAPIAQVLVDSLLLGLGSALRGNRYSSVVASEAAIGTANWPTGGILVTAGTPRDPQLLRIQCPAEIAWSRELPVALPVRSGPAPEARTEALSRSRVPVVALLGQCELTALQLAELAVGDVLACTQSLTEPLELCIAAPEGTPRSFAQVRPGHIREQRSLEFISLTNEPTP